MEIKDFLERLNSHSKAIYENEIVEVAETGKITNWLLGLAAGALLFSFNRYSTISNQDLVLILIQSIIFMCIVLTGFLHRLVVKSFRSYTVALTRMLDFLRTDFELVPDVIEYDLKNKTLKKVYSKYIDGNYFEDKEHDEFIRLGKLQMNSYSRTLKLTVIAVVLMMLQFACYFIVILK